LIGIQTLFTYQINWHTRVKNVSNNDHTLTTLIDKIQH